jgi:hypothetical protein
VGKLLPWNHRTTETPTRGILALQGGEDVNDVRPVRFVEVRSEILGMDGEMNDRVHHRGLFQSVLASTVDPLESLYPGEI